MEMRGSCVTSEVPLPPGRVRVTVEVLPNEQSDADWTVRLGSIQETLRASGYRFRTRTEIGAQIESECEGWDSQACAFAEPT